MSFLLRAALVIGTLSYFAATRGPSGSTESGRGLAPTAELPVPTATGSPKVSTVLANAGSAAAVWSAMPAEIRQRLAQEAAAEFGRRIGPAAASRDTLAETDRKAPWRGANEP